MNKNLIIKNYLLSSSILYSDFSRLGEEIEKLISSVIDIIHFDVMDNHYVTNLTIGPCVLKYLRKYGISIPVEVHIMAKPIDKLLIDFANSGADYIIFHPESTNHLDRSIEYIKQ